MKKFKVLSILLLIVTFLSCDLLAPLTGTDDDNDTPSTPKPSTEVASDLSTLVSMPMSVVFDDGDNITETFTITNTENTVTATGTATFDADNEISTATFTLTATNFTDKLDADDPDDTVITGSFTGSYAVTVTAITNGFTITAKGSGTLANTGTVYTKIEIDLVTVMTKDSNTEGMTATVTGTSKIDGHTFDASTLTFDF